MTLYFYESRRKLVPLFVLSSSHRYSAHLQIFHDEERATSRECTASGSKSSITCRLGSVASAARKKQFTRSHSIPLFGCGGVIQDPGLLWRGMEVSLTQMRTELADSQRVVYPERPSSTTHRRVRTESLLIFFFRRYCRIRGAPISIFGVGKLIDCH